MGQGPHVSIVIVNYNSGQYLRECLRSLLRENDRVHYELIIIDNASENDRIELLQSELPGAQILLNSTNLGFAKAANMGLQRGTGRYLWLLNPDTRVGTGALTHLVDFMERHPEVGIVGPKVLNTDGSLQLACHRKAPTPWVAFCRLSGLSKLFPGNKSFSQYNLSHLDPDEIAQVDAVSGSTMLIRDQVVREIGYLDEAFFLYGEDLDFCYRAKKKGWTICYNPWATVIHHKGGSSHQSRLRTRLEFYRAMVLFHRKHFAAEHHPMFNLAVYAGVSLLCTGGLLGALIPIKALRGISK
jgi:GT2 family glycosyltransferase